MLLGLRLLLENGALPFEEVEHVVRELRVPQPVDIRILKRLHYDSPDARGPVLVHALNDVVPKLAADDLAEPALLGEGAWDQKGLKHVEAEIVGGMHHRLLSDVTPALVLAEFDEVLAKHIEELDLDVLRAVLEEVLHDVVPVLAAAEFEEIVLEVPDDRGAELVRDLSQELLDNAAAEGIEGELPRVLDDLLDDEVEALGGKLLEAFLDDVISILLLDDFKNVRAKLVEDDLRDLVVLREDFYGFLDDTAPKRVLGKSVDLPFHQIEEHDPLILQPNFKHFLDHEVPERIPHQVHRDRLNLLEDRLLAVFGALLKEVLDLARSDLVA